MKKKSYVWGGKTDFCLLVLTKSGEFHRHYFDDYDDLSWNAVYYEFSPNIVQARGMVKDYDKKWKCAFRIG